LIPIRARLSLDGKIHRTGIPTFAGGTGAGLSQDEGIRKKQLFGKGDGKGDELGIISAFLSTPAFDK
jgi:hypothetical protein